MLAAEYNLDTYGALPKHELQEIHRSISFSSQFRVLYVARGT
jgi:hypothetical protein